MSLKRFCDYCFKEIPGAEYWTFGTYEHLHRECCIALKKQADVAASPRPEGQT